MIRFQWYLIISHSNFAKVATLLSSCLHFFFTKSSTDHQFRKRLTKSRVGKGVPAPGKVSKFCGITPLHKLAKITLSSGQVLTKNLIFQVHLSTFGPENTSKSRLPKTKRMPKHFLNYRNFEKVLETTLLTPKIVQKDHQNVQKWAKL